MPKQALTLSGDGIRGRFRKRLAISVQDGFITELASHRRLKWRAQIITVELDSTDDPTRRQQEFAFFNGHYDA